MRIFLSRFATLLICAQAHVCFGQTLNADEIVSKTHSAYKTAKNKEQVEGITLWCRDAVKTLHFMERQRLMIGASKMIEANKIPDANVLLEAAKEYDRLDENLADLTCKPATGDLAKGLR